MSRVFVQSAMAFAGFVWMVHSENNSTDVSAERNENNNTILANQTLAFSRELCRISGMSEDEAEHIMDKWLGKRQWDLTTTVQFEEQVLNTLRSLRIALIIVDFQNDFVDGSLKIGDGDAGQDPHAAIGPLNELIERHAWDTVVYTQDWHPANHISFLSQAHNSDREMDAKDANRTLNVFDSVQFLKPIRTEQILYPDHCVQKSWGAEMSPEVAIKNDAHYVMKGVDPYLDSYSAFFDNNGKSKTELEELLHKKGIQAVVIAGLAYDICVRFTCLDAVKQNFLAAVVPQCSAGLTKQGIIESEKAFEKHGVSIVTQKQASEIVEGGFVPKEWVRQTILGDYHP